MLEARNHGDLVHHQPEAHYPKSSSAIHMLRADYPIWYVRS